MLLLPLDVSLHHGEYIPWLNKVSQIEISGHCASLRLLAQQPFTKPPELQRFIDVDQEAVNRVLICDEFCHSPSAASSLP